MSVRMLAAAVAVGVSSLLLATAAEPLARGAAGTQTRKDYCQGKYDQCLTDAATDCARDRPGDPKGYNDCYYGATSSCNKSWGDASTCVSEDVSKLNASTPLSNQSNKAAP